MPGQALTDFDYWSGYWRSHPPVAVPEGWYYAALLRSTIAGRGYSSLLELGRFPGSFGVYTKRFLGPSAVLSRHVELLAPGGTLLVTVPNFRGLNGILGVFNPEDLAHHNLELMTPTALEASVARCSGLADVRAFYYGRSGRGSKRDRPWSATQRSSACEPSGSFSMQSRRERASPHETTPPSAGNSDR